MAADEAFGPPSPAAHALLATVGVSVLPVFVILCIPLLKTDPFTGATVVNAALLRTLLAFAVGGLLGDALLHLLPHALEEATPETVGLLTLGGMFVFFGLEKVIRGLHQAEDPVAVAKKNDDASGCGHSHGGSDSVGGLLNLVADFSHNWTDGLALAAAFQTGRTLGLSTAVAVLLHEIPHEVGDYALLVRSGVRPRRALLLQLVTAIGALLGCGMGLVAGDLFEEFQLFVLPFTAGGFIYIALSDTVPTLMQGISLSRGQSLKEAAAACVGVAAMLLIGLLE